MQVLFLFGQRGKLIEDLFVGFINKITLILRLKTPALKKTRSRCLTLIQNHKVKKARSQIKLI